MNATTRRAYPTDLSDAEWAILEPLVPPAEPGGRPRSVDVRGVVNGIRYVLRSGAAWRLLPHDLPPWQTCYAYFRRWQADRTWERIAGELRRRLRVELGRRPEPSAGVSDSQTAKTTEEAIVLSVKPGEPRGGRVATASGDAGSR